MPFSARVIHGVSLFVCVDNLDRAASLERAAHVTLCLVEDLHAAQDYISAWTSGADAQATANNPLQLPSMRTPSRAQENEFAQFLLKLAPRIRTLEAQTVKALGLLLQDLLQKFASLLDTENSTMEDDLLVLGHCMRGLALLGRGKEVESIFARTAIMPLIRSLISMGRLDQGGSRGECAGLVSLLEEITTKIKKLYGPVLSLGEITFCTTTANSSNQADVDLLSEGVWVPIATALMADAGIKMAIFSPGIASILQANYVALDNFLSGLAVRLLAPSADTSQREESFLYQPEMTASQVEHAQDRIYAHPKTAEFIKKWNLPIYYQLRFGESCNRLNKAVDQTRREGWVANVFSGESSDYIREKIGLELSFFQELFDVLIGLWRKDVILPPLTNRFLRGSVQLVGRSVSFVSESMDGKIKFGEEPPPKESNGELAKEGGAGNDGSLAAPPPPSFSSRPPYCWGDSQDDVAAVAWELTVLESALMHECVDTICSAMETLADDLRPLVIDVLREATQQIHPVIDRAWNDIIVNILTTKCSAPLAAVKGVAATYRMTNRPPPTQASHWVVTILRPLQEFCQQFTNRIPDRVGSRWKQQIVVTVSDRYAAAVKELLTTVERTENALRTRRAVQRRQASASTLSDGEKVKLQVYLDYQTFRQSVSQVGIDPATVIGLSQLEELTAVGVELQQRVEDGL